jgi:two-component system, NarL family, nitrate/nitrite response regulator NarL
LRPRRLAAKLLLSVRCIIIDDSEEFLASASRLLGSQGMDVIAVASTGDHALHLARELGPDVALVDIELGEEDGIELSRELASRVPATRVVLISSYGRDDLGVLGDLIANSPAAGFLPKTDLGVTAIARLLR